MHIEQVAAKRCCLSNDLYRWNQRRYHTGTFLILIARFDSVTALIGGAQIRMISFDSSDNFGYFHAAHLTP